MVPQDQADQISERLVQFLVQHYGSLGRFKRLAADHGWFKPDTIDEWFRGSRVPEAPTLLRLKKVTGISLDWLATGIGLPVDMPGQLYLDALDAEDRLPPPDVEAVPRPARDRYSGSLLAPGLDQARYRVIACRFCAKEYRQFLGDPSEPDGWSPAACSGCREELVDLPQRRAELQRERLPGAEQELERRVTYLAEVRQRIDRREVKEVEDSVKRAAARVRSLGGRLPEEVEKLFHRAEAQRRGDPVRARDV